MISVARQILDELVAIRQAIQGLRRDLKRRDARDQADQQQGELVVLSHPPIRLDGKGGR